MSRIKILIFLITLGIVSGVFAVAWWVYTRVLYHDDVVKTEIKKMTSNKKDPPDPGLRRFDKAIEVLQSGSVEDGKAQLYDLVQHFPDSKRATDAKRIIGEMNMDALFSAANP